MKKNVLVAAIDFSEDYSQICYFDGSMQEPESMSTIYHDKHYLIPSVMWFEDKTGRICYGDEALNGGKNKKGILVKELISKFEASQQVRVREQTYEAADLIEKYFSYLMLLMQENKEMGMPKCVAVTVERLTEPLAELFYKLLENKGYSKADIRVISHSEAFLYYGMSRDKELFVNDVVMFDYNCHYFMYRRFSINRKKRPQVIETVEKDFTEEVPYALLDTEEGKQKADKLLAEFVQNELQAHVVSTVYLTGTGFYEEWMQQSLPYLCTRRRVFKGYNLFVKGACYAAMEKVGTIEYKNMIFRCNGRTWADILIQAVSSGKKKGIQLSKAGDNWYEAGAKADFLVNADRRVVLMIESPVSGIKREIEISIEDFPVRPPKTTRIGITIGYSGEDTCVVCVEDKGFGDFYKSSGQKKRKVIDMKEYL